MLGFIFGTVCLIGLVKMLRRGGYHGGFADGGYRCGHDPDTRRGGWRGFGGQRVWLRSIFERMETTPGQEKVILSAIDELRANRSAVREEFEQTRADLARAVASGLVEDATLEESFARHDRLLARIRVSFVEATRKITEALDERQRKQFAELLEGRKWFGRGPRWSSNHHDVWA